MFGVYSNRRLNENERRILYKNPDDYNWYCIYLNALFKDSRLFQVREDIKLPHDDDGVVLIFKGGDIVYFKTLNGDATDNEAKSILDICIYLVNMFKRHITAYVVCPSDASINVNKIEAEEDVTINFSAMKTDDGEKILSRLEKKLKKNKKFTVTDSIEHMLLPYSGFKNKEIFQEKFRKYMNRINENGEC